MPTFLGQNTAITNKRQPRFNFSPSGSLSTKSPTSIGTNGGGTTTVSAGSPTSFNQTPVASPLSTGGPQAPSALKSPAIAGAAGSVLGSITANNLDPSVNQNVLNENTKSSALGSRLGSQYNQNDTDNTLTRDEFGNYKNQFDASTGTVNNNTSSENSALSDFYKPDSDPTSVLGRLNALSANRAAAVKASATRAMGVADRSANVNRLAHGGGSYQDAIEADTMAGIGANTALDNANQLQQNYLYVKGQQGSLLGRRNAAITAGDNRLLQPAQARDAMEAGQISRLGATGNIEHDNTVYTMDSPQAAQARQLALLGQASSLDNSNNFYVPPAGYGAWNEYGGYPETGGGFGNPVSGYNPYAYN